MNFDDAMREAARAAERAVSRTIRKYREDGVIDEPEISTYLVSQLDSQFDNQIGGLKWRSSIVRNGSGSAADEKGSEPICFSMYLYIPQHKLTPRGPYSGEKVRL